MKLGDFRLRLARWIVPEGWVIVPKEPTREMLKAACASMSPGKRPTPDWLPVKEKHKVRYRAMINANPIENPNYEKLRQKFTKRFAKTLAYLASH